MPMKVAGHPCPRRRSQIQTDVVTGRAEQPIQNWQASLHGLNRVLQIVSLEIDQRPRVNPGGDQKMSIIIGIAIQEHRRRPSTPHEQIGSIFRCLGRQAITKKTSRTRPSSTRILYILRSPRCPDLVHRVLISRSIIPDLAVPQTAQRTGTTRIPHPTV